MIFPLAVVTLIVHNPAQDNFVPKILKGIPLICLIVGIGPVQLVVDFHNGFHCKMISILQE